MWPYKRLPILDCGEWNLVMASIAEAIVTAAEDRDEQTAESLRAVHDKLRTSTDLWTPDQVAEAADLEVPIP